MEYSIIFIFFALLLFTTKTTWSFGGVDAHPLYFVFLTQILILTLPGVLILTFLDDCVGSITCEIVTFETKIKVMFDYFIILITILLAVLFSYLIVQGRKDFMPAALSKIRYLNLCFFITILIILLKIIFVKQVPLIMALIGNKEAAEIQKAAILRGEDGFSFPIINFLIKYFPLYFYYSVLISYFKRKVGLFYLLMAFFATSLAMLYDLQKAPVVIMIIGSFWLYWAYFGKTKMIIIGAILSLGLVSLLFYVSYDFGGDNNYFVNAILNRTFVAQDDGMYWVYQYYNNLPNKEFYAYWGIPLAQQFGLPQIDPLSDIIGVVFPDASDSWVNTTTFLLGEAKAIFGNYSLMVSAFVVFINVTIIMVVSSLLMRISKDVFYPAIFVMLQTIPFANNITDLLYGRFIFGFLVFMLFPAIFCMLCYGKMSKRDAT
ncbi:hypothetical protein I6M88_07355 [Citrobacter sedlakii]|uniref:Wzy n=1 Tax=Citrobacter sedlakii TaxID=67826 RepID=A0ABS0ZPQ0_9ENTR|nr:hypothetical protein [Citrobacter sedlakii]MBJ8380791.1 hypothetical protein [Citrobacter sedlakii]